METLRNFAETVASAVAGDQQQQQQQQEPEFVAALTEAHVIETHVAELLEVCERSQRTNASMLLGSDFFAESLSRFVSAMQQCPGESSDTFVSALAQFSALQRELRQQRKELDDSVNELLVVPLRTYLSRDAKRVSAAVLSAEKARKSHEKARRNAEALERQIRPPPDPTRLLQAETELDQARRVRDAASETAMAEATDASARKDFVLLSDFRQVMLRQLQHYRYCAQVLEASAPLIASLDEHCKNRAREFESQRESRRAAAEAAAVEHERKGRHAPLLGMLSDQSTLSSIIAAASASPDLQPEVTEQLLASTARALDAQPGQPALRIIRTELTNAVSNDTGSSTTPGAAETNALFALRGSSPLTRFLGAYTRLHTSRWLGSALHGPLSAVLEKPELCEIDPTKVQQSTTADGAAQPPDLDVVGHAATLATHCTALIDSLQTVAASCPAQVREIFRHMRSEITAKRGEQAGDLALGGLLFLRLVCPTVMHSINPATEGNSAKMRPLILIAKTLQAIAGEGTELKEPHMKPMQDYVLATRPRLRALYDALCTVTEAEVVSAEPLASAENVSLSDLPLISDILRTHFAAFTKQLSEPQQRPLLVKLAKVLSTL